MSPPHTFRALCTVLLLSVSIPSWAQFPQRYLQNSSSWPHAYPGMPIGKDYGPQWQDYFQVTENLPNVSFPLPRNWAGNIPVQRHGRPNNTLFFWAFESSNGSFTANSTEPWAIWLSGGPGASSLAGLLLENGPIRVLSNYSLVENKFAWSNVADYVKTGFSTCDDNGQVVDEDQVAADFMGFLDNFVKVFPGLATRPFYLSGESYAGIYIPYIARAYFMMSNPPVKLSRIAIGNGVLTSYEAAIELPVMSILETYPQIINYDTEVFEYFRKQHALCGYNLILEYPQPKHFPTLNSPLPSAGSAASINKHSPKLTKAHFMQELNNRFVARFEKRDSSLLDHRARLRALEVWKRDLTGRANGTIDPWYLCDLYTEMIEYALNYTHPWSSAGTFDPYNIPDGLAPEVTMDPSVFLNDPRTRSALHAPTSKVWSEFSLNVFMPTNSPGNFWGDPSPPPMTFLTDLATNATAHNISIILYSGNDDSLVPHAGTQIAIQNTTFGGIQGFTRKPDTPWYNDMGEMAGIAHQERGWKYILVKHAGHLLAYSNPISALTLAREFIFGNNPTGLVTTRPDGNITVIGGDVSSLAGDIMTGQAGIYVGEGTTASTYFFPSMTVSAWDAYIATATATPAA